MLTEPHRTLLCNLNQATLLPSVMDKVPQDCLTDYLLAPFSHLLERSLGNDDFSWITGSFYLKGDRGKNCAGFSFATPFDVVEAVFLSLAFWPYDYFG